MKQRTGNCNHGLSLDIRNADCCLVCSSPKIGSTAMDEETLRDLKVRRISTTQRDGYLTLRYAPKPPC